MAISSQVMTHAMGITNITVLRVVTDAAAAAAATFNVGFKPRKILVHNLTDRISQEWLEGMANGEALQTIAAGTRTLDVANGPTLGTAAAGTENSFTLPATTMLASKTFAIEVTG